MASSMTSLVKDFLFLGSLNLIDIPINATNLNCLSIRNFQICSNRFFEKQVISGCYWVVSVDFDASKRKFWFKFVFSYDHFVYEIINRHFLDNREQALRFLVSNLSKPRMIADLFEIVPLFWVYIQNSRNKICTLSWDKLRNLIVSTENLFV